VAFERGAATPPRRGGGNEGWSVNPARGAILRESWLPSDAPRASRFGRSRARGSASCAQLAAPGATNPSSAIALPFPAGGAADDATSSGGNGRSNSAPGGAVDGSSSAASREDAGTTVNGSSGSGGDAPSGDGGAANGIGGSSTPPADERFLCSRAGWPAADDAAALRGETLQLVCPDDGVFEQLSLPTAQRELTANGTCTIHANGDDYSLRDVFRAADVDLELGTSGHLECVGGR